MERGDATDADRKHLLRMLVQQVALSPVMVPEPLMRIQVLWRSGVVTDFTIPRRRGSSLDPTVGSVVLNVVRELAKEHKTSKLIAEELNRLGLRDPRGRRWYTRAVAAVRCREGLRSGPGPEALRPPYQRADGLYTARGVAARLVPHQLDPKTLARLETLKLDHAPRLGQDLLPDQRADGLYSARGVAARLRIPMHTVRY